MNANTVNLQEWEPFGGGGFGTSYSQIMAGKAICIWPSAYHTNLPFLQGKKMKTAISLFIGDRIKFKM